MTSYQVTVRKDGTTHVLVVEASTWTQASVQAIRKMNGGVITDIIPLRNTHDIVEL